ncbi:MAG: lipoyl(octanoyl) transferase LipB [Gemmatimonadales bacterium]
MAYSEALGIQRSLAQSRIDHSLERDTLLLVEHPPVITLGRNFKETSLPTPREELRNRGIEVFSIDRGGDVTFHGPGQLVGYPIYDLTEHRRDLHWFLRQLETALMRALSELGVRSERNEGYTGVWTADRKIASIGIHVKHWVTWHGFALNVLTDLSYFELMEPCGMADVVMTSVARELGAIAPRDIWGRALDSVILGFSETFGQRPQMTELQTVLDSAAAANSPARPSTP